MVNNNIFQDPPAAANSVDGFCSTVERPIRLLIVDDHPALRFGLTALFEHTPGFIVVGEAGDGAEAVEKAQALKPDVILMDLALPKKNGLDAMKDIHQVNPEIRVIIFTAYSEGGQGLLAIKAGAIGYLAKDTSSKDLVMAVRDAHQGKPIVTNQTEWREVILYAFGKLVYESEDLNKPLALVAELCPEKTNDSEFAWWQVSLAGDILHEIGLKRVSDSPFGCDLLIRVQTRLVHLIEKQRLTPRERNNAGKILSKLGDPRFNAALRYLPADENLGFTLIPAGKFLMGSNERSDEKPQEETLPDYWMGLYPVTVAQFRAFTEATNYPFERWQYNDIDMLPVVSVTWHEAVEYTKWVNDEIRQFAEEQLASGVKNPLWQGLVENKLQITLPTKAEWEKAARCMEGYIFPLGNDLDSDIANSSDPKIEDTDSTESVLPRNSLDDLLDVSGNIWEWTRSVFGSMDDCDGNVDCEDLIKSNNLVCTLRGSSFNDRSVVARWVFRDSSDPVDWFTNYGFRLVISSILPL
jgi:formylglycine-generating enzyme required for sulfatase activity/ActR/RegA family two-component response regulator